MIAIFVNLYILVSANVAAALELVLYQLKGHRSDRSHTLKYSWVLELALLAFHYNILEDTPQPGVGTGCNPALLNQEYTAQVHIVPSSGVLPLPATNFRRESPDAA